MKRWFSVLLALTLLLGLLPLGLTVSAAPTIITEVRATVSTPVVGYALSKLNDTYTPTEGVEITDLNWTKSNGVIYPDGTKFMAGVTYYCDMEFTVKEGYTFPNSYTQLKGYINGVVGEISTVYYTDHAYVTAAFTPVSDGEVFVAGIGMNDGDYLPVGGTSTTKSKVSDRYAFYNDGVLTLHNYTFRGTGLVIPGMYSYYNAAIVGESLKEIVVEGNCELVSTSDARYDECIWFFPDGMETRGTIRGNGNSQLTLSCRYQAIDATQGLTIQDATLTIQNAYDGLEAYGDSIVKNSTIDINVDFYAWYVKGNLSVTDSQLNIVSDGGPGLYVCGDAILDNSTIGVNSFETALLTGIYDSDDPNSCDLSVMNCDLTLVSKDSYGIFSEESALIYNSTVTIESVEKGIYAGKDLSINGSQAMIQTSEESAIYCREGNAFITSSTVTLPFAGNDGINGDNLYITGSQVTVIQAGDCGIETFGHMVVANSELSLTGDYGIYSEGDLSIEGSELAAIGKRYGILAYEDEADIAITDSTVLAVSTEKAALIADGGILTIDEGLTVQASTDPNGTLGAFSMDKIDDYRLVLVSKPRAVAITKESATASYAKMGDKVSAKVTAEGDGLTYTWYIKNDGASKYSQSSITSATYSATMSSKVKGRRIYCVVKDRYGNEAKSKTFILRESVSITKEPATAAYAQVGAKASVKITASGDGLKYTWYVKNDGASKYSKSSITSATYSVTMSSKVKDRRAYCVVTDKYGKTVQSKTFLLRESVSITTQPKTVTVKKNATAKVTVKASGDGLKYTWYVKNEGASKYSKSSITKSTYSVTMTSKVKNRLVYCVVTDKYGNTVKTVTVKLKMK